VRESRAASDARFERCCNARPHAEPAIDLLEMFVRRARAQLEDICAMPLLAGLKGRRRAQECVLDANESKY
jgi:hypothetical protein